MVLFAPEVENYLYDLVEILYQEEYFGFYESADNYVALLVHDIVESIAKMPSKPAPLCFSRYGRNMSYAIFKKSKQTQWYVFFNQEDDVCYIRYISNNHVMAQYL